MQRRQRAVQYVIHTVVVAGLLDGGNIGGLLHHAHQPLITRGAGAVGAGIDLGDVVADGAQAQVRLDLANCARQQFSIFVAGTQDVKSQTLRALAAHAGQFLQLFNESSHGLGESGQNDLLNHIPGRPMPPSIPPRLDFRASSTLRDASLTAAITKSWIISISPDLTASGSMVTLSNCFCPLMRTVTLPPPDDASMVICCIFSCSFSACCRACANISCKLNPPIISPHLSRALSGRSPCESRRQIFPACAAPQDRPARGYEHPPRLPDAAPLALQLPVFH